MLVLLDEKRGALLPSILEACEDYKSHFREGRCHFESLACTRFAEDQPGSKQLCFFASSALSPNKAGNRARRPLFRIGPAIDTRIRTNVARLPQYGLERL